MASAQDQQTICLLMSNPVDRRLLSAFLRGSGYDVVHAWQPLPEAAAGAGTSLILADEQAAHRQTNDLLAFKRRSGRIFMPLVLVLDGQSDSAPWLLAGFDDVLRQPLIKAELAARLAVLLRLRQQTIAQSRAEADLRNLSAHLRTAREEERMMIARELHDELAQVLAAAKIDIRTFARKLAASDESVPLPRAQVLEALDRYAQTVDDSIQSIRTMVAELRPALLADEGLASAVEWQVQQFRERTGLTVELESNVGEWALDLDRSIAVYRVLQESLANIARHAQATRINISLRADPDGLHLEVRDNGRGIRDGDTHKPKHFGIMGMRERVTLFGGEMTIRGAPGEGTTVLATIPFDA